MEYTLRAARTTGRERGFGPPALVGFFGGASGIAQSVQLASRALTHLGIEHRRIDVLDVAFPADPGDPSASAWIFHLNPPELVWLLNRWGPKRLIGPRYGYWAWELPQAPDSWIRAASVVNGVMAPSRFTADAFGRMATEATVTPHPLFAQDFEAINSRRDRPSGEDFRVVGLFDFKSSLARKNPWAALDAFKQAFGDDPGARLFFKTHNAAEKPELLEALQARAGANVEVIDAVWDRAQVLAFIAGADALISMHRAEGFGLTLAEAMMLGTPVIATGWSGNLDFMTEETACLVSAKVVPVEDDQHIYKGQTWADPDTAAAARGLRRLRDDPASAAAQALRARTDVAQRLAPETWFRTLPADLRAVLAGSGRLTAASDDCASRQGERRPA